MFPFPTRKVTVYSPLRVAAAIAALRANVGPRRSLTFKEAFVGMRSNRPFVGKVAATTFAIQRVITGRNSFLPLLKGTVTATPHGSAIAVRMTMHWSVQAFQVIWLGLGVKFTLANPRGPTLHSVLMFTFGLILPHIGFWPEVKKAEAFLVATLKGEVENPASPPPGQK